MKAPEAASPPQWAENAAHRAAPAKPMFDACVYRYRVSTTNPECQAFVDQALGMYYSYVWMEAARAFETALTHDPECAYAWLMLHRVAGEVGPRRTDAATGGPFAAALGGLAPRRSCRSASPSRRWTTPSTWPAS